jgi:murein DD-endopeptidase MepM/ murein hydrolase activator NlpD
MPHRHTRRALLGLAVAAPLAAPTRRTAAQAAGPVFGYPMAEPGRVPGDGFEIRAGYACENLPAFPGWWHTGENWHRRAGDSAGAAVVAAAEGEVVFAGYDYPGPVVIVRHAPDLFSQYGHLDYALEVAVGDRVARGRRIGTVLGRADAPSHLHFELRTFYQHPRVNGDAPEYGVHCGYDCPPGPGYWPIGAPEHPSDLGWRNPTHVIARRAWPDGIPAGAEVVVAEGVEAEIPLWTAPAGRSDAAQVGALPARPGDRYPLLAIDAGDEADRGTSAEATRLWYRFALPDGGEGWAQAAVPSFDKVGSDGRPSAIRFALLPATD